MRNWFWRFLPFIVIGLSIVIALFMIFSKKDAALAEVEKKATSVRVISPKRTDERLVFQAYGTVQANRELTLHPEVSGKVIKQSENLVVGGIIQKGEVVVKIDPRDYLTAVEEVKAAVERAKYELQQEQGRQIIAEREWELLDPSTTALELGKELALRKPQVREKEAALAAAESRLEKAKIDLDRTIITSPFDAVVINETVEVGEIVTQQTNIATLVAIDEFRVQVSIPYNQLQWISLPSKGSKGSKITILQEVGAGKVLQWDGYILRLLGDVDPKSRMARILVGIPDPLGVGSEKTSFPLLIGTYVRVKIEGPKVEGVFALPREAIHNGNEVWIMNDEDELEIRKVDILFKEEDRVIVQEGIQEGEKVIVSNISIPIPGMKLREM